MADHVLAIDPVFDNFIQFWWDFLNEVSFTTPYGDSAPNFDTESLGLFKYTNVLVDFHFDCIWAFFDSSLAL